MEIALVPIQCKIKFNVGPGLGPVTLHLNISILFPVSRGMRLLNVQFFFNAFLIFVFARFSFLHHCHCKNTPITRGLGAGVEGGLPYQKDRDVRRLA